MLDDGPAAQTAELGAAIWRLLLAISSGGQPVHLQWVPANCGIVGNERADELAKEASGLPQQDTPIDVRTATKAVARAARWTGRSMAWCIHNNNVPLAVRTAYRAAVRTVRASYINAWPPGWYRPLMGARRAGSPGGPIDCRRLPPIKMNIQMITVYWMCVHTMYYCLVLYKSATLQTSRRPGWALSSRGDVLAQRGDRQSGGHLAL